MSIVKTSAVILVLALAPPVSVAAESHTDNFSLTIVPNAQDDFSNIEPVDNGKAGPIVLVSRGKPRAGIVLSNDPTSKERAAARRLQEYVNRMTGVHLPLGSLSAAKDGLWLMLLLEGCGIQT